MCHYDGELLTDDEILPAGELGEDDVDVRRVVPLNGGTCGRTWNLNGECLRNFAAVPDTSTDATAGGGGLCCKL